MKPSATWCLHQPDWPKLDRALWAEVFRDGDWLDEAGAGAHLRPKTQGKYAENYGHWLAWLSDHDLLASQAVPTERVSQERVIAYAKWMQGKVAPVTALMRIEDLLAVLRLFDPLFDTSYARKILQRMCEKQLGRLL